MVFTPLDLPTELTLLSTVSTAIRAYRAVFEQSSITETSDHERRKTT